MRGHRISDALDGAKLNGDAIKINEYIVAICIAVIILCTGYTVGKAIKKIKRHSIEHTFIGVFSYILSTISLYTILFEIDSDM